MREIVHLQTGQCGNQVSFNTKKRLVPNSGKLSLMNMVLTQLVPIMGTRTCSWRELMYTIMKPLEGNMFQELSWWTWNLELWTLSVLVLLGSSLDQTTLSLVSLVLVTIGLKVTTLKAQSWLILF
jgi:hypothetical protein